MSSVYVYSVYVCGTHTCVCRVQTQRDIWNGFFGPTMVYFVSDSCCLIAGRVRVLLEPGAGARYWACRICLPPQLVGAGKQGAMEACTFCPVTHVGVAWRLTQGSFKHHGAVSIVTKSDFNNS